MQPIKVLFVCIGNTARSQMADAFLNHYGEGRYVAESAGFEPGILNPYVIKAMQEVGIDISHKSTNSVFEYYKQKRQYDYVVTVCDGANAQRCPTFIGDHQKIRWTFDDPASFKGSEEEILAQVRVVRDTIKAAILDLIKKIDSNNVSSLILPKNEDHYRNELLNAILFNAVNVGICYINDHGEMIQVNRALCKLMQRSEDQLLGMEFSSLIDSSKQNEFVSLLDSYVKDDSEFDKPEWKMIDAQGQPLYVVIDASKIVFDKTNHEIFTLLSITDITQQRNDKEMLIRQARMAEMGSLIGVITHQWNQPINSIGLLIQDIQDTMSFDELTDEYLDERLNLLHQQTLFMAQIVRDFSNFFKPGKEQQRYQICGQVEKVIELVGSAFLKQNVQIIVHEHEHFHAQGYANEFQNVILNIFNNARDALLEKNNKHGRIDCFFEKVGLSGIIRIRDNAGGIPAHLLPDKIFDSYVSTKGDKGTGIGLHISRKIIQENMGGRLWVHNVDEGAEFVIELPLSVLTYRSI